MTHDIKITYDGDSSRIAECSKQVEMRDVTRRDKSRAFYRTRDAFLKLDPSLNVREAANIARAALIANLVLTTARGEIVIARPELLP